MRRAVCFAGLTALPFACRHMPVHVYGSLVSCVPSVQAGACPFFSGRSYNAALNLSNATRVGTVSRKGKRPANRTTHRPPERPNDSRRQWPGTNVPTNKSSNSKPRLRRR
ncbi:Hemoglobin and hemoglobin-haptoglobin binding protein C [Anopheles sinensis]|uniref:Hemoglobin and hemoglobin-haptoglobin binding protein C n=1 Tax=Anopheles sinensis TaxID=74873 RepID=A0A084VYT5_ANOSI|nr:Hemoglobin and hemoglobin-haptoglobin binding protein C [Anopheles sinensis]